MRHVLLPAPSSFLLSREKAAYCICKEEGFFLSIPAPPRSPHIARCVVVSSSSG